MAHKKDPGRGEYRRLPDSAESAAAAPPVDNLQADLQDWSKDILPVFITPRSTLGIFDELPLEIPRSILNGDETTTKRKEEPKEEEKKELDVELDRAKKEQHKLQTAVFQRMEKIQEIENVQKENELLAKMLDDTETVGKPELVGETSTSSSQQARVPTAPPPSGRHMRRPLGASGETTASSMCPIDKQLHSFTHKSPYSREPPTIGSHHPPPPVVLVGNIPYGRGIGK